MQRVPPSNGRQLDYSRERRVVNSCKSPKKVPPLFPRLRLLFIVHRGFIMVIRFSTFDRTFTSPLLLRATRNFFAYFANLRFRTKKKEIIRNYVGRAVLPRKLSFRVPRC